jgi:RNA polymerase sigma-70 factor, ECF subfamily
MNLQQPSLARCCNEEFSEVAGLHMPVIFRFLLSSLRDRDLAETMTQECFLRAYRNRATFRGDSSIKTWLMRIAINLQKDHWRNRRMQFWREARANSVDVDDVCDQLPSGKRTPETEFVAREQVARIWKVIPRLSMRERSVFLLRYVEELELSEIGQCTGLKVGAVKVYLARAIAKIREALGEANQKP